jgi:lipopolysaccharide biosynthesis regulator YciM
MGTSPVGRCRNRRLGEVVIPYEDEESSGEQAGDYVDFVGTGVAVVGEYHCTGCGYGVTVHGMLPPCPMCASTTWEQVAWSPFTRARV